MKKITAYFNGKGKTVGLVLSLLPALFAVILALYFIWGPGEGYLHADWTDSMVWANVSVETGEVFDPEFRYAGMLPFSVSALFVPLIHLFGAGMTAQNIGMSLIALLYIGGVMFVCRSSHFSWGWSSIAAFVSLMAMSGSDKLREMMYGHNLYYTLGPIILFYGLGFLLRAFEALSAEGRKEKRDLTRVILWLGAFFLLCIGTGTDMAQVIAIGSLPAFAGLFAERLFSGEEKLISKKNKILPIAAIIFLAGSLIGLLLWNSWRGELEAGYANAYSGWSDVASWHDNAAAFTKQFFTLIGVNPSGILFSLESVGPLFRLVGGILLLAIPVIMFVFYRKLSGTPVRAMLWGHTVVTLAVLLGFICGKLSGVNWRLMPILGSASVLAVFAVRELFLKAQKKAEPEETTEELIEELVEKPARKPVKGNVPLRLGWIGIALLAAFSITVSAEILSMPASYGRDNTLHLLTAFLEKNDLEYGYATFWQSQSITLLSDSKVLCRMVNCSETEGVYSDYYQSSRRWYRDDSHETYFVLLSEAEYSMVSQTRSWKAWINDCLVKTYTRSDGLTAGFRLFVFSKNVLNQ
ncbi:MAG: hypothetical protein J5794_01800 [Lachnospiraceae bacterium]|nr:hypothetical protein [Lachnospiraceae bacterium]